MEYSISKNGQKLTNGKDFDVCKAMKKYANEVGAYAKALGVPDLKCPMGKVRIWDIFVLK